MGEWMYKSSFLTSALIAVEWLASRPGLYPKEESPGTHCIVTELGPDCLDNMEKRKI
jgi:hypothetical protein